jgi:protocatechuate 3,4-dioxygenase beta subunit
MHVGRYPPAMRARRAVTAVVLLAIVAFLVWRTAYGPVVEDAGSDADPAGRTASAAAEGARALDDATPSLAVAPPKPAPYAPPVVPEGLHVTGRVVDAAGKAVAGARVVAAGDVNATTFALEEAGREGSPATATTTDAEGRFALAVSDDAPFHVVFASAEGHGVAVKPAVAAGADVVLALPRATALVGTVTDRDGKPVVGARVRVLMLFDAMKAEREATSGAGGAYRVANVPPTGDSRAELEFLASAWVEVLADGYAPAFLDAPPLPPSAAETRLDLVLSPGITVHGKVVDEESGAPIEGATVDLQSTEEWQIQPWVRRVSLSSPYAPRSLARRTTGADGAYRFEHVPGALEHEQTRSVAGAPTAPPHQPTAVLAWRSGFAPQGARIESGAQPATPREVVLRLRRAGAVSGRVVEADGTPVAGATVVANVEGYEVRESSPPSLLPPDAPRAAGRTGADGRFLLTGVAGRTGGSGVAVVETYQPIPDGAVPGHNSRRAARVEARLDVGRTTDVGDLQFPALVMGATRRVRVLDAQGRPVWGAKIVDPVEVVRTDRAGEAVWSEAEPENVGVRAAGFAPASIPVSAWEGVPLVEVRLERGRRVSGRVLRADRTPAAGATVAVARGSLPVAEVAPDPESAAWRSSDGSPMKKGVLATATTHEDGAFEFVDLAAGPWHLGASLAKRVGMGPDALLRTVVSDVASDSTGVELVLPADDSPALGRLEARVVSPTEGEALEGVVVTLLRGDDTVGLAVMLDPREGGELSRDVQLVKPDGRFAFGAAPVGSLSLEVTARGWLPQRVDGVEVREGATTAAPPIVMRRGAVVRGTLRAPGVASWIGRRLWFWPAGGGAAGFHAAAVAEDGTYRVTGLSPGTYGVQVPAEALGSSRVPPLLPRGAGTVVVTGESSETAFDVDLVPAGMITLEPSDPRLPPPLWDSSRPATEAQAKFGAATRVLVTAVGGAVVFDRTGAFQGGLYDASGPILGSNTMTLLPGHYVARIDYPGGESLEEVVVLDAGPTVHVHFRRP